KPHMARSGAPQMPDRTDVAMSYGPGSVAHHSRVASHTASGPHATRECCAAPGTRHRHCCEIATPQGSSPTWMLLITLRPGTSITDTSFDTPLVTNSSFSSGVNAICQTR